jgi:hypothetical protein
LKSSLKATSSSPHPRASANVPPRPPWRPDPHPSTSPSTPSR